MTALFSAVSKLVNSKIGGSLHILLLTRDADHDNLVAELKQNIVDILTGLKADDPYR